MNLLVIQLWPCSSSSKTFMLARVTWQVPGNTDCWAPPPGFLSQYVWEVAFLTAPSWCLMLLVLENCCLRLRQVVGQEGD